MPEPTEHELTFLFTDIEQSTGLVRELGEEYCDVLAGSRSLLRRAVAEHGGREIECRADEFFAVFTSAEAAVEAARNAQRSLGTQDWPGGASVTVRIGLHTGIALDAGDGLVGARRASRVPDQLGGARRTGAPLPAHGRARRVRRAGSRPLRARRPARARAGLPARRRRAAE